MWSDRYSRLWSGRSKVFLINGRTSWIETPKRKMTNVWQKYFDIQFQILQTRMILDRKKRESYLKRQTWFFGEAEGKPDRCPEHSTLMELSKPQPRHFMPLNCFLKSHLPWFHCLWEFVSSRSEFLNFLISCVLGPFCVMLTQPP